SDRGLRRAAGRAGRARRARPRSGASDSLFARTGEARAARRRAGAGRVEKTRRFMKPPVEIKVPMENVNDPTAKVVSWAVAPGGATIFTKKAEALMAEFKLDASLFAGLSSVKESDVRQKLAELGQSPPPRERAVAAEEEGERVPLPRAKLFENRELLEADRA